MSRIKAYNSPRHLGRQMPNGHIAWAQYSHFYHVYRSVTDQRTNRLRDTFSYRDARMHLGLREDKTITKKNFFYYKK